MEQGCLGQTRQRELRQKRTGLYALLLYAQKKYRETGESCYLDQIRAAQEGIAACDKVLRQTVPED